MKNIIDYVMGTFLFVWISFCTGFITSVMGEFVLKHFLQASAYIQHVSVSLLIFGAILLIAALVNRIAEVKEYIKIIKQIDRNPNTPPAADQVEDYSFKSLIKEIV